MNTREAVLRRLEHRFGPRATRSESVRRRHGARELEDPGEPPEIVVFPESTEEVQEIVRACAEARIPVIPYGAGTSLEGNANAPRGGVCLDMGHMNHVLAVHPEDMDCCVQAGITREGLNAQLLGFGVYFPIDSGAEASIGGMASTRASGSMAVRYGTMRDNVLALQVVLPDGRVVRTSRRSRKSAPGYDVTKLFIGAEGTLGIITEVTLRLHPVPEAVATAACPFGTLEDAVGCVAAMMKRGLAVARIELLDEVMLRGVNLVSPLDVPELPTLFLEFHGTPAAVEEQVRLAEAVCAGFDARGFHWATRPENRSRLWSARDSTRYAALALRPGARAWVTDVCVPVSRLAECLLETRRDIERSRLVVPIAGHVGDGNFHLLAFADPASADQMARAQVLHESLVRRAMDVEGACMGEPVAGTEKGDFLEQGGVLGLMRQLKQALDPLGIMNPGKIFRERQVSRWMTSCVAEVVI